MSATISPPESDTLTPFLKALIKEGAISESVAHILNRLPTAKLQATALDKIREQIPSLTEQIVMGLLNPSKAPAIPTPDATPQDNEPTQAASTAPNPFFYPYSDTVFAWARQVKQSVKNGLLDAVRFFVQKPLVLMLVILGLFAIGLWKLSEVIARRAVVISPTVSTLPEVSPKVETPPTVPAAPAPHVKQSAKASVGTSSIPTLLRYHRLSSGVIHLSWRGMGKNAHYRLYSAPTEDMRDLKRESPSAIDQPSFDWTPSGLGSYWIAVTAVDADGHQGELSTPLHMVVK